MQAEVLSDEVVRCSIRINLFHARDEVYQLSMLVNDELDCIRTVYIRQACDEVAGDYFVEVGALAPADLIAPSPRSYHTYYTLSPTYGNFRFIRVQELTEIQHSYH